MGSIRDFFLNAAGIPRPLSAFAKSQAGLRLAEFPALPDSIDAKNVVAWHLWGELASPIVPLGRFRLAPGVLVGRGIKRDSYTGIQIHLPELENFCTKSENALWSVDLQDVTGMGSSKSPLDEVRSMEEFAEQFCGKFIEDMTPDGLANNLAWREIRIFNPNSGDYLCHYSWEPRLYLMNSGGSHHFAAARHIAKHLGRGIPITARMITYRINPGSVWGLNEKFDMFLGPADISLAGRLHDHLEAFQADYFFRSMPRPLHDHDVFFLPKNVSRSRKAAAVLRDAGMFDLGGYLQRLCTQH